MKVKKAKISGKSGDSNKSLMRMINGKYVIISKTISLILIKFIKYQAQETELWNKMISKLKNKTNNKI